MKNSKIKKGAEENCILLKKKGGGEKSKDATGILGHMFLEAARCRGHRQSKMGEK